MKVMLITEGNNCALRIEPQDEEGRALLATYGVGEAFTTRLAPPSPLKPVADLRQVAPCDRGALAEVG
jgi:hypothetical protein